MAKKKTEDEAAESESDGSIAVNDAWTGMLAISLLALVVGSGFLAYDYMQYDADADKLPKVTKFTATPPGPPPKAAPVPKVEPKVEPKDAAAKDADKKEPEKKDAEK